MSPSWRERIIITLSPRQVTVERYSRGVRPVSKERLTLPCAASATGPIWQPALDALRSWLAQPTLKATDAHLVLSNHFVRYLLIPSNPDLVTQHEEFAFARARFLKVFGGTAEKWVLKLSRPKPDVTSVASAVERALLDALTTAVANSTLKLRSIQPGLMAAFNARSQMPTGHAWIVVAEPGRLLLALLRTGDWQSLRSRPLNGNTVALAEIIEQERLLVGIKSTNEKVYLHRIGEPSLDIKGLNVERWLADTVALQAPGAH